MLRLLGTLFILLAFGALALDVIAMQQANGGFELHSLDKHLVDDLSFGEEAVAPYREGFMATVLSLPSVAVLGGIGILLLLINSMLFSSRD